MECSTGMPGYARLGRYCGFRAKLQSWSLKLVRVLLLGYQREPLSYGCVVVICSCGICVHQLTIDIHLQNHLENLLQNSWHHLHTLLQNKAISAGVAKCCRPATQASPFSPRHQVRQAPHPTPALRRRAFRHKPPVWEPKFAGKATNRPN